MRTLKVQTCLNFRGMKSFYDCLVMTEHRVQVLSCLSSDNFYCDNPSSDNCDHSNSLKFRHVWTVFKPCSDMSELTPTLVQTLSELCLRAVQSYSWKKLSRNIMSSFAQIVNLVCFMCSNYIYILILWCILNYIFVFGKYVCNFHQWLWIKHEFRLYLNSR